MAKQTAANAKGKTPKGGKGYTSPSGARGAPQNIPGKAGTPKPAKDDDAKK
ncbi:MAG: hypothetical protein ACJA1L_002744 [Paracoccaceae bacterium]|jgi:hypothetical protein